MSQRQPHRRRAVLVSICLAAALAVPTVDATAHRNTTCPTDPDPRLIANADQLRDLNQFVSDLGVRPTGSPAHEAYVDWIRQHLAAIPGVQITEQAFTINRWNETAPSTLRMDVDGVTEDVPVAATVDYAKPTGPNGVAAPLTLIADATPITAANAKGKIVVRPAPAGSVSQALFYLPVVQWAIYDPKGTIDPTKSFYGDFLNYNARVTDLNDAATAGAAGIVFVKDRPHDQVLGHYEPYEGVAWGVPGLWLGSDEGAHINAAIAAGKHPTGRITVNADFVPTVTKSLFGTIGGQSAQRLVVESHTDGTNAVEDNGPVAMIEMARYFAGLPMACRPRTIEFAFATAHFYQRVTGGVRMGGAEQLAQQLDTDYGKGLVSTVVTLEHLGARQYSGHPRAPGLPGVELRLTGLRAIQQIMITPSPALVGAVWRVVTHYNLDRTMLLQGADAPGATSPLHCNFGGEGWPFNRHDLPTVGVISAPETLYDPAFGMEGIDFNVMSDETRAYTALVLDMGRMSQLAVSGVTDLNRTLRTTGLPACPDQ